VLKADAQLQVAYALATVSLARWIPILTVASPACVGVNFWFGVTMSHRDA
jgi:hypothetical protein